MNRCERWLEEQGLDELPRERSEKVVTLDELFKRVYANFHMYFPPARGGRPLFDINRLDGGQE